MNAKEFTCAMCGGTFDKETSDEDAAAEYRAIFETMGYAPIENGDVEVVCDDCWQVLKPGGTA